MQFKRYAYNTPCQSCKVSFYPIQVRGCLCENNCHFNKLIATNNQINFQAPTDLQSSANHSISLNLKPTPNVSFCGVTQLLHVTLRSSHLISETLGVICTFLLNIDNPSSFCTRLPTFVRMSSIVSRFFPLMLLGQHSCVFSTF